MSKIEWITFDCYGTLVDWDSGVATALASFLPFHVGKDGISKRYVKLEAEVEKERYRPYRDVLAVTSTRLMEQMGYPLPPGKENTLPDSLPNWPAFPEVPTTLQTLHAAGYRLAILSNIDRDLLAASITRLGVTPDLLVTAQDCHSYKPALGHWQQFEAMTGASPGQTLHVAASLFHDIIPATRLGYRTVFVNRHNEPLIGVAPTRVLHDLSGLPQVVNELAQL